MNDTYLKSARILLRQYRDSDFSKLVDLNSDPEVMKFLNGGTPGHPEEVQGAVERTLLYKEKYSGHLGVFSAELLHDGEFIGWFHLRPDKRDLENTQDLELGYRLKKKFWGQEYATEVSRALITKAFRDLGARSVFARTVTTNLASRRVMEKLNMRFEKEYVDPDHAELGMAVIYRVRAEDWLSQS